MSVETQPQAPSGSEQFSFRDSLEELDAHPDTNAAHVSIPRSPLEGFSVDPNGPDGHLAARLSISRRPVEGFTANPREPGTSGYAEHRAPTHDEGETIQIDTEALAELNRQAAETQEPAGTIDKSIVDEIRARAEAMSAAAETPDTSQAGRIDSDTVAEMMERARALDAPAEEAVVDEEPAGTIDRSVVDEIRERARQLEQAPAEQVEATPSGESIKSPEQLYREELVSRAAEAVKGTVALHTHLPGHIPVRGNEHTNFGFTDFGDRTEGFRDAFRGIPQADTYGGEYVLFQHAESEVINPETHDQEPSVDVVYSFNPQLEDQIERGVVYRGSDNRSGNTLLASMNMPESVATEVMEAALHDPQVMRDLAEALVLENSDITPEQWMGTDPDFTRSNKEQHRIGPPYETLPDDWQVTVIDGNSEPDERGAFKTFEV